MTTGSAVRKVLELLDPPARDPCEELHGSSTVLKETQAWTSFSD